MTVQLSAEETTLLIDSLRRLLEDGWPVEGGLERAEDVTAIGQLSSALHELGLAYLGAAEGPGLAEALLIFEELGRAAAPAPLAGALIANLLLDGSDDPKVRAFVEEVQAGQAVPALALGAFDGDRFAGSAAYAPDRLTASLKFVEDVAAATHILVFVSEPSGLAIMPVDAQGVAIVADPGLAVPALSAVDIAAPPLLWQSLSEAKLADAAQAVRLLALARAVGAAQRGFDLALDHAKVRRQFGHVIGEFQAIQHKLVNCFSQLDGAKLLLSSAGAAHDRGDEAWRVLTDAALAFSGPALRQVALEVHHTLGAIGYAEEHEAPRHFRRIHADLLRFGGTARARAGLADYLLRPAV
ncbi:acyl-CoA dehydrogenase family protein [Sphingobium sp.]|uniref:acyl-CoA dehydrogenase family protein n=1 Tax=Sphingobium sp. TaxID=1912891 RepID=UPI0028BE5BA4|nr:acyl-CoA dehydrogenase family protein [Sphingobium sp.]